MAESSTISVKRSWLRRSRDACRHDFSSSWSPSFPRGRHFALCRLSPRGRRSATNWLHLGERLVVRDTLTRATHWVRMRANRHGCCRCVYRDACERGTFNPRSMQLKLHRRRRRLIEETHYWHIGRDCFNSGSISQPPSNLRLVLPSNATKRDCLAVHLSPSTKYVSLSTSRRARDCC